MSAISEEEILDDRINQTRYRTLVVAMGLAVALSLAASFLAYRLPGAHWAAWGVFLLTAAINLSLIPAALAARRRGDRAALERIAMIVLALGAAALMQRIFWNAFAIWPQDPTANPFRPAFHFLPFFFIAAVALMRARRAIVLCWLTLGIAAAVTVVGMGRAGIGLGQDGTVTLLVWLFIGNPLFILLLHALPQYEDALAASEAEVARMRERTELLERLTESERRFNLVVDSLQVGVWDRWLGPPERRWWSPRFYELIGYTPDELEPTEANLLSLLHPDDRDTVWKAGTKQLLGSGFLDVDFRLRTRDHGYRWFNSHAKADRDAAGRIVRIAGAIDDIHEQRMAQQALHEAQEELTQMAYRDTLTDLNNRRAFDEHFAREWRRARRAAEPLSLLLMDLDYFKLFNDCYGHVAGDQCLQQVARQIQRCARRSTDFSARLGGEEFALILPDTSVEGALEVARAVRETIRGMNIRHDASPMNLVTISVGAATVESVGEGEPRDLFEQADRALYEVKARGRDGVLHARDTAADGAELRSA